MVDLISHWWFWRNFRRYRKMVEGLSDEERRQIRTTLRGGAAYLRGR